MKQTKLWTRLIALLLALVLLGSNAVFAAEQPVSEDGVEQPDEAVAPPEEDVLEPAPVVDEADLPQETEEAAENPVETEEEDDFPFLTDADELPLLTEDLTEDAAAFEIEPTEAVEEAGTPGEAALSQEELPVLPAADDYSNMSDAALIAMFQIPDNWARPALLFCVRNGLMSGRGDGTLSPLANTKRAELATMLTRVLKTTKQANLSAYSDIKPGDWFYTYMAQAVAAGLFQGAGNKLMPEAAITREQAFAVLARMFGICSSQVNRVYGFSDGANVSAWARPTMAGMIEAGYVRGTNGKLNPQKPISRQELAQVLYNLLTGLGTSMPINYTGSYALAANNLVSGAVVHGDLLLSNEVSSLTLSNITVDGRLTIQGVGALKLTLQNCRIGNLAICRPATVQLGNGVKTVTILADTTLSGSCTQLNVHAGCKLIGSAVSALVYDGNLTIPTGSSVGTLTVEKGTVTNNGTITTAEIFARNFKLAGSGSVSRLNVYKSGVTTTNTVGKRDDTKIDTGLTKVTVTRTDKNVPTAQQPKITAKIQLSGFACAYPRDRYMDVTWKLGGSTVKTVRGVKLQDNVNLSCTLDFTKYFKTTENTVQLAVVLSYDGTSRSFTQNIKLAGTGPSEADILAQAMKVRTQDVQARMNYAAAMYSSFNGSSFSGAMNRTAPAGAQVTLLYTSKGIGAKIRLQDGTVGWVAHSAVSAIAGNYYTTTHYSKEVKEAYVNKVRNWNSTTGYLIWVSLWTQEVCIFTGSKGNWKLLRSDPCCSGANQCPTPVESVSILYKVQAWYYDEYYCHHVSVFDSARGFHSWPIKNGTTSTVYDSAMGWPNSQSCIRMMDEAVTWIYDNIPLGTAVEIY